MPRSIGRASSASSEAPPPISTRFAGTGPNESPPGSGAGGWWGGPPPNRALAGGRRARGGGASPPGARGAPRAEPPPPACGEGGDLHERVGDPVDDERARARGDRRGGVSGRPHA